MYYTNILVSVTEICTVGCSHCGFKGSIRERQPAEEEMAAWVTQACDWGIPAIIFTGGEPFQRFSLLKAGVQAVARHPAKPRTGCFTSSFWGKDRATVDKILDQLPGLTHLYLSTDVFHQERVPAQYVRNVIDGAIAHGIRDISLCITIAKDEEEQQFRALYEDYGDRLLIHVDRVISTPHIDHVAATGHPPLPEHYKTSCWLHTPIINPNGDLCACHVAKVGAHRPLDKDVYFLGNLKQRSFREIMEEADADYGYQYLRAFGPQGVARLVNEDDELRTRFGGKAYSSGCDMCSKVLLTRKGREKLEAHVADPFQQALIDTVRERRFGEVAQDQAAQVQAQAQAAEAAR
ncbi:radical SAM protein [Streptomyces cellulosae]|uniref:radical SAM protein n=1 Tax=Streptomyces cellulosae TaxID=1968 RepID=UPI0004C76579|nr:radical SAM protein [Streptomyces cellulosae]